jgi:hypothetical protein
MTVDPEKYRSDFKTPDRVRESRHGMQQTQADEKAQFRLRRGELILKEVCNTTTGARWGFEPLLNRKLV